MKTLASLALALLIAGCATQTNQYATLTPVKCREYGVVVSDWVRPTGTIVASNPGTPEAILRECNAPPGASTQHWAGCAQAVGTNRFPAVDGRYEIWYINHTCTAFHEMCHALYQKRAHTEEYDRRAQLIGYEATCPVVSTKG